MTRALAAAALLPLILAANASLAATVSTFGFESGYGDDEEIAADGTFLIDDTGVRSDFVSLSTPGSNTMTVEAVGDDATDGFWYDSASPTKFDEASPLETDSDLGAFFLRTTNGLSGGAISAGPVFRLTFIGGVSEASGELWDIDGSNGGTESWDVVANLRGGGEKRLSSPVGSSNDETSSFDGQAWRFGFSETGNTVLSLDFVFTGTKTSNVGAAFDNLSVTQAAPIPLPASAWMLIAAVGGLGAMRRLRAA